MGSILSKAYTIKIQNFEGPFDLLFHLIEKDKIDIYDIPINEVADQYMDYLFRMHELDMDIASEFLVMAATLLHIKSRLLLPEPQSDIEDEIDPREELILKLVEYKRYKEFAGVLKQRENIGEKYFYKEPENIDIKYENETIKLSYDELSGLYTSLLERNRRKTNKNVENITQILKTEKVSLRGKIREVIRTLLNKSFFKFSELFSPKTKSRLEIATGFLAILELTKLRKTTIAQQRQFSDIVIYKCKEARPEDFDDDKIANKS